MNQDDISKAKVIGIVGGMGPHSGMALFGEILNHSIADKDQDYLDTILMSFPKDIVDRSAYLNGESEVNPAFNIVQVILKLEVAGANVVGIACNTAHSPTIYNVITSELEKSDSKVELVNMPEEVGKYINDNHSQVKKIGLMTTNGTYKSGVYKSVLKKKGFEVIMPDSDFQKNVIHKMIYDPIFGIKKSPVEIESRVHELMTQAIQFFTEQKVDAIILGCTELSLALKDNAIEGVIVVHSTEILAKALVEKATYAQEKAHSLKIEEV